MTVDATAEGCAGVQADLRRFAGGLVPRSEALRLRAHLRACADCRESYHLALKTAAVLGEGMRREQTQLRAQRHERRLEAAKRAYADPLSPMRRVRPFALRSVLVPALFIVLMMFVARVGKGPPRLAVKHWSGVVEVAGGTLAKDDTAPRLVRGSWLVTGPGATLVAALGKQEFSMGERSHVLVEANDRLRLRLAGGTIEVGGPAEVTTAAGIAELPAGTAVRLAVQGRSTKVLARSGTVNVVDASGSRTLAAGEELEL